MSGKGLIVEMEGISRSFGEREVIRNCTMNLPEGSIYGFLGPNGAGKTTVMKILTGLLKQSSGHAKVLGMDVSTHRDEMLGQVGSLIEVPIFFEHLSAKENLQIHLAYMDKDDNNVMEFLEMVGLEQTGSQAVSTFSLGMRQRLAIARAVIHKPKLLILDEPINGLDPLAIREMRALFKRFVNEFGMSILISSHIISELEQVADIIGIIVNGSIIREMHMTEIRAKFPNGLEEYFFEVTSGGTEIA
ncbi:ATP-binding cassette domain-containing protein [Paenibacillus sp. O199]|uniref:ABC transporter ATP-binding protein n=1 Tax=Paenibacillus sp. O199 TaxID=1643925 RepID=UPI0007BF2B5C|nr:ATP-binding cassette domain-containing protein [Paenibacillus sp. O199]